MVRNIGIIAATTVHSTRGCLRCRKCYIVSSGISTRNKKIMTNKKFRTDMYCILSVSDRRKTPNHGGLPPVRGMAV